MRRAAFLDRLRPGRCDCLQGSQKLASRCGDLPLAIERGKALVPLTVVSRIQSLGSARQLRVHLRRRPIWSRQSGAERLKLRVHLGEARHVLASLEGLRQLDGDHLLEPRQLTLAALLAEELAPEESPLLQLILDGLPFLRLPGEASANVLGELRGAL